MTSDLILDLIWTGGVLLVDVLLLLIPLKVQSLLTTPFSLKTFGIRKIRRWHSRTDTLANLMIWISVLFCIASPWISYSPAIYMGWLTLTWLCTVSRAIRLTRESVRWKKLTVIFLINLVFGVGFLSAAGLYNHFALWIRSFLFANEMMEGQGTNVMYYLSSMHPAAYGLQVLLMAIPLTNLWGQFKYMRLENTFKAANLGFYIVKMVCLTILLFLAGVYGQAALEKIYQVPAENRISPQSTLWPMMRSDLQQPEDPEPVSEEPAAVPPVSEEAQPQEPVSDDPAAGQPADEGRPEQAAPEEAGQEVPAGG